MVGGKVVKSSVIIKEKNYKPLVKKIVENNKYFHWNIEELNGVVSVQDLFNYLGLKVKYNDLEGYAFIDVEESYFFQVDYYEDILNDIVDFVEDGGELIIDYDDYDECEKICFWNGMIKKYELRHIWKEV